MATKTRKRFSHQQYVSWGRLGGSPVLASLVEHRPVKGYKVTHVGKVKHSKKR